MLAPNPRLQRTPPASPPSPLSRKPLGGVKELRPNSYLPLLAVFALVSCEPADCSRVIQAHAAVHPGMTLVDAVTAMEAAQLPDLDWAVSSTDPALPRFEISKQPYRLRFYSRPSQKNDLGHDLPYEEVGLGSRAEFREALVSKADILGRYREVIVTMGCLHGGVDRETFTLSIDPNARVQKVSPVAHVRF